MISSMMDIAREIVWRAREAGATWDMIRTWDLLPGDCDYIREERPGMERDEERSVMIEVEAAVRDIGLASVQADEA